MPSLKNQENLKDLTEKFKATGSVVFTEYRGLNVSDISELRKNLRKSNGSFLVAKNTLIDIALKEMKIETSEVFSGPTAIVFQQDGDLAASAKTLFDFASTHTNLKIKSAYIDGNFVGADIVKRLSSIPPREVLLAQLLGVLNAPICGFVNVLAANIRGLVNVLNAAAKKETA